MRSSTPTLPPTLSALPCSRLTCDLTERADAIESRLSRTGAYSARGARATRCSRRLGLLPSREACDEQGLASRVCDAVSRVADVARALVAAACRARTQLYVVALHRVWIALKIELLIGVYCRVPIANVSYRD